MKLIKFRITEYKSIKDSGYCWLASDVTTLAGKNESGKSGILEALRDFDINIEKISDEAMPLDQSGEPTIELVFEVDKETLNSIAQEQNITIDKNSREYIEKNGVAIFKYFKASITSLEKLNDTKLLSCGSCLISLSLTGPSKLSQEISVPHKVRFPKLENKSKKLLS